MKRKASRKMLSTHKNIITKICSNDSPARFTFLTTVLFSDATAPKVNLGIYTCRNIASVTNFMNRVVEAINFHLILRYKRWSFAWYLKVKQGLLKRTNKPEIYYSWNPNHTNLKKNKKNYVPVMEHVLIWHFQGQWFAKLGWPLCKPLSLPQSSHANEY